MVSEKWHKLNLLVLLVITVIHNVVFTDYKVWIQTSEQLRSLVLS